MMTRKHFEALAEAIRTIPDARCRETAAFAIARVCKAENPAFNFDRFMTACGVA